MSEAKGIEKGAKVKKHGLRASHTSDVHLDDCRVPAEYVLGGKEKLDARLARAREGSRARVQRVDGDVRGDPPDGRRPGARHRARRLRVRAGLRQGARAVRPQIIENQAIAFTLARMKMEIDAARLLVWRAAWMGRNQVPFDNAEGSMSKLKAGEVAVWVTERAMQILGGNGYTREFPVERMHRDAKIYDIFEGTAEIQQLVIARAISGDADPIGLRGGRPDARASACHRPPARGGAGGRAPLGRPRLGLPARRARSSSPARRP